MGLGGLGWNHRRRNQYSRRLLFEHRREVGHVLGDRVDYRRRSVPPNDVLPSAGAIVHDVAPRPIGEPKQALNLGRARRLALVEQHLEVPGPAATFYFD